MLCYIWEGPGLLKSSLWYAPQLSGASILCFHILSSLRAHWLTTHGGCNPWWLWPPLFTNMAGSIPFLNTQYPVTNHNGIEYKKRMYICITKSPCCTAEIGTHCKWTIFQFFKKWKKKVPVKLIFLQFVSWRSSSKPQNPTQGRKIKPTNCFQYNQNVWMLHWIVYLTYDLTFAEGRFSPFLLFWVWLVFIYSMYTILKTLPWHFFT